MSVAGRDAQGDDAAGVVALLAPRTGRHTTAVVEDEPEPALDAAA